MLTKDAVCNFGLSEYKNNIWKRFIISVHVSKREKTPFLMNNKEKKQNSMKRTNQTNEEFSCLFICDILQYTINYIRFLFLYLHKLCQKLIKPIISRQHLQLAKQLAEIKFNSVSSTFKLFLKKKKVWINMINCRIRKGWFVDKSQKKIAKEVIQVLNFLRINDQRIFSLPAF